MPNTYVKSVLLKQLDFPVPFFAVWVIWRITDRPKKTTGVLWSSVGLFFFLSPCSAYLFQTLCWTACVHNGKMLFVNGALLSDKLFIQPFCSPMERSPCSKRLSGDSPWGFCWVIAAFWAPVARVWSWPPAPFCQGLAANRGAVLLCLPSAVPATVNCFVLVCLAINTYACLRDSEFCTVDYARQFKVD